MQSDTALPADVPYVPETSFGKWFLGTDIWEIHVLRRALEDLNRLMPDRKRSYPVVADVGCGWGQAFRLLKDDFAPERIVGIDVCPDMIAAAKQEAGKLDLPVDLYKADCADLPLPDESVDIVFCHQSFHHLVEQDKALSEFHRILKPGGLLLFAESTRAYIHSWIIRLLFRHPMDVQRDALEYIAMVRGAGFEVDDSAISYPYLWWSRPDLGIVEQVFGAKPAKGHAETLINLVAVRP
jgi:ubiquinone/menaquinone biosynthesis C-methylase UbiE